MHWRESLALAIHMLVCIGAGYAAGVLIESPEATGAVWVGAVIGGVVGVWFAGDAPELTVMAAIWAWTLSVLAFGTGLIGSAF